MSRFQGLFSRTSSTTSSGSRIDPKRPSDIPGTYPPDFVQPFSRPKDSPDSFPDMQGTVVDLHTLHEPLPRPDGIPWGNILGGVSTIKNDHTLNLVHSTGPIPLEDRREIANRASRMDYLVMHRDGLQITGTPFRACVSFSTALQLLATDPQHAPFFPNLHTLVLDHPSDLSLYPFFVVPSLQRLVVSNVPAELQIELLCFLNSLNPIATRLNELTICGSLRKDIIAALPPFPSLVSLVLKVEGGLWADDLLLAELVQYATRLPNLKSLAISAGLLERAFGPSPTTNSNPSTPDKSARPGTAGASDRLPILLSLQAFSIKGTRSFIHDFLRNSKVFVSASHRLLIHVNRHLKDALKPWSNDVLDYPFSEIADRTLINQDRPSLPCSLIELHLTSETIPLDRWVQARKERNVVYTFLTRLTLDSETPLPLSILPAIALMCPNLVYLKARFAARLEAPLQVDSTQLALTRPHPLRTLVTMHEDAGESVPAGRLIGIARMISGIFPSLGAIEVASSRQALGGGEDQGSWEAIRDIFAFKQI